MFGYVNVNQQELKIKDYQTYHAFYCGLCQELKKSHGRKAQMTLNYDMAFLVIFLTALHELEIQKDSVFCPLHPSKKQDVIWNEATSYGADMNILLSYQTLMDGWRDEKNRSKKALADFLKKDYQRLLKKYPRQGEALELYVEKLSEAEKNREKDIDRVSGLTGAMLSEVFLWKEDYFREDVRWMAFFLGKFIYLMDACEDMEKDQKAGRYNVFLVRNENSGDDLEYDILNVLNSMMSECAKAFERLPILEYAEILRNILYSGIWTRYEVRKKRLEEKGASNEKSL